MAIAGEGRTAFLSGKRMVSTRPRGLTADVDDRFEKTLAGWGADVYIVPLVKIEARRYDLPVDARYDWLFFTSKNGVQAFYEQLSTFPPIVREAVEKAKIGVVGPTTGKRLLKFNQDASFIPPVFEAEVAATAFIKTYGDADGRLDGLRILWPCGNLANRTLADRLQAAGAVVDAPVVYETSPQPVTRPEALEVLREGVETLIFTSPSAVEAYQTLGIPVDKATTIAVLGPVTERTALAVFGRVDVKAPLNTLDALAEAIYDYYAPAQGEPAHDPANAV